MSTLEVGIFQTKDLSSHCSYEYNDSQRAAKRAKTWVEGTFSSTDGWDVSVNIADEQPDPKVEGGAQNSFTQCCLCTCDSGVIAECTYNTMFDYWGDWLWEATCKDPHFEAADANLLLTDYEDGGGLATSRTAVACMGREVARLPASYSSFGYTEEHKAMCAVLEELGHCFLNRNKANCADYNQDDDATSHDDGVILYDRSNFDYAVTPMRVTGTDTCHNNCKGTSKDTDYCKSKADDDYDGEADGWAFQYSDCATCLFVKK